MEFPKKQLLVVGDRVLITPEEGGETYDRFRDRVIVPIGDPRGRVISFGGRALDPKARAKYLNGPDSELFDKGRVLYGLTEARRLLRIVALANEPVAFGLLAGVWSGEAPRTKILRLMKADLGRVVDFH